MFAQGPKKLTDGQGLDSTESTSPKALDLETLSRYRQRGAQYIAKLRITTPLRIGYSNNEFPDGSDPWGVPCHVAVIGYEAPGGAEVLAAAKPISGNDNAWAPLLRTVSPEEGYLFNGKHTPYIDIIAATALNRMVLEPSVALLHTQSGYKEWLGFLLELRDSTQSLA